MNYSKFTKCRGLEFIILFFIYLFSAYDLSAKPYLYPPKDRSIEIKGNERVSVATIFSHLKVSELKNNKTQNSLKSLYESELFSEANIVVDANKIIIEVKENPLILDVKFSGNKKIESESLMNEISLKRRVTFSKSRLESDLRRINDIYMKTGRYTAKIEPKIIPKDQNRIELIFDIDEGEKSKISKVYFVGNKVFSDEDLRSEIASSESKWWKFLSSSDFYDADRIDFDKERLRRFYLNNGYVDFSVILANSQMLHDKKSFFVTFLLDEGLLYKVGEINVVSKIPNFDGQKLRKKLLIAPGKKYNAELVEKTIDSMVDEMSENSYAFANIEPVLKRQKLNSQEKFGLIDIDFVINESMPIYINHINIVGNVRTMDEVIRRELRVKDGDPYNLNKINRSKQRIENLGFFESVEIKTKRIGETDLIDLEIEVKEKKTGELNLGIGYSTVDQININAGIKERNFLGTGQEIGFNVQKSYSRITADISYTKPKFNDQNIDVGFDIFKNQLMKRNSLVYSQDIQGIGVRGDYSITEFLGHQIRYFYRSQTVGDVDATASPIIKDLTGTYTSSGFGQSIFYDKRDNRFNPREGYFWSISQDLSGFAGNVKNLKQEFSTSYYQPIVNKDYVFKLALRGGTVDGIGQALKSNNGFFLGGNDFRGFEFSGIGPRTKDETGGASGGSIVGGKNYYVGTAELMFPLGLPKELGINGILFSDNGTVYGVDENSIATYGVADSKAIRSSAGFSLAWRSPMGPIRFDFSRVLKKENYDRTQNFRFSFGSSF